MADPPRSWATASGAMFGARFDNAITITIDFVLAAPRSGLTRIQGHADQMRLITTVVIALGAAAPAYAWDRGTVQAHIVELCEQRNPDDWPAQDACIADEVRSLKSLRPPKDDAEFIAAFKDCKSASPSEFAFTFIRQCYEDKTSAIVGERTAAREAAESTELERIFPSLPVIVQCSFSDGRKVEIRKARTSQNAVVARIDTGTLIAGESGVGYSYEWGGPQGADFKLEGNQLTDRSNGPVKLFMGQCQYN